MRLKGSQTGKGLKWRQTTDATGGLGMGFTRWLVPALIILLTAAAFLPALQNGFVAWDDDGLLLENPHYRGLGWGELHWMFTTFYMGHYQPLSWVSLGLDYLVWGMEPFGYHLTSFLLHAVNAVLCYFLALRLISLACGIPERSGGWSLRAGAGFAALFFALHPLRVESVVWATERRDVLSGLFLLWTVLLYLRAVRVGDEEAGRWWWLSAAMAVYVLSLLSKAAGITLPIVLLVLDVYPLRRLGGGEGKWFGPAARRIWFEKIPFLILALVAGAVAPVAQHQIGALKPLDRYGVVPRVAQALFGLAFYLEKTVIPLALSPLYEIPVHLNPWDWPFLLSGVVVLAVSTVLIVARQWWPSGLVSWIGYIVILAPVLGLTQSGPQIAADRYSYLSCLGWAILSGGGLFYLWQAWSSGRIGRRTFMTAMGVVTALVVGLGVLTWRQAQVWHDSETLWRHILAVAQKSYFKSSIAHNNLASVLVRKGELEEGIAQLRQALQIDPAFASAHFHLGNVLVSRGEVGEAIEHYRRALQVNPAQADVHVKLGNVLAAQGALEEAIRNYREALRITPTYSEAHFNLANALVRQRKLAEAIEHFQEAVRINPDFVEAYNNLGRVLAAQGHLAEAMELFRKAVEIHPDFAEAHISLSQALAEQGKKDEAVSHYQEALRILKLRGGASAPR